MPPHPIASPPPPPMIGSAAAAHVSHAALHPKNPLPGAPPRAKGSTARETGARDGWAANRAPTFSLALLPAVPWSITDPEEIDGAIGGLGARRQRAWAPQNGDLGLVWRRLRPDEGRGLGPGGDGLFIDSSEGQQFISCT